MGNRKVYEGSSRGKCAGSVQTMATAHLVEKEHRRRGRTREERWISPCRGKETSSSRAAQRINDLQCCQKSSSFAGCWQIMDVTAPQGDEG